MRHSGKGPWLPNDTRFKLGIFLGEVSIFFSMREVGLIGLVLHESWSLGFSVEVQNHQLGLLCTVPRPNGTNLEKTQSNKYMKRLAETLVQHLEDIRPVKVCFQLGIMYDDNGRILTSLVGDERILQTTPPEPPDSSATRSRMKSPANKVNVNFFPAGIRCSKTHMLWYFSPVFTSQSLTVPSSLLVTTNLELNWRHVTADWCLLGPELTNDYNLWIRDRKWMNNEQWQMTSDIRSHYNPTWQGLKALSSEDIPDLDGGIGIAGDQDVVSQLHPRGQALDIKR